MGGNLINKVDPVTEFLTRVQNAKDEDVEQKNDDMCSDDSDKKNDGVEEEKENAPDLSQNDKVMVTSGMYQGEKGKVTEVLAGGQEIFVQFPTGDEEWFKANVLKKV